MKICEINVSRAVKMNLGNYESLDHFVSMKLEVMEGEDVMKAATTLAIKVERALARQVVQSYKIRGKRGMATMEAVAEHHGLGLALPKKKSE